MDLELKAAGDDVEVELEDEYGIKWTIVVRPCLPDESNAAMKRVGLPSLEHSDKLSPESHAWAQIVAQKHTRRIVKAERHGEPVTVNGAAASACDVAELLRRHDMLARLITFRCLHLGGAVVEQRGN